MWSKVGRYVEKYKLLNANDLYLVALSGGADSVALLLLLCEHGYRVHAAHCNFHLRGDESERDEQFCVALCERLGIPLHRAHFDTHTYAKKHKVSIEMAARELRYNWFEQVRSDVGAAGVCVAHHRDDSVETVLLNLIRGTGLRGLTGIRPRNGNVLRPLLCVSRAEIEAFLREKGQEYVTDSTNLKTDVMRNKVRSQVLPLMKTLNSAVVENIQRTAENLIEAQQVLDVVNNHFAECKEVDISELAQRGSSEYLVFEWARRYGFNGSQIAQILEAETGKVFLSSTGYELLVDRGRLMVEKAFKPMKSVRVIEEGTYVLEENVRFSVKKKPVFVSKEPYRATVDASKVEFPLTVRMGEEGDWLLPYGMTGRKLLSDLMTDRKMTLFEKRRQLLVVDARGVVVWAVGLRVDARVAVTDDTQEVLELRLERQNG